MVNQLFKLTSTKPQKDNFPVQRQGASIDGRNLVRFERVPTHTTQR